MARLAMLKVAISRILCRPRRLLVRHGRIPAVRTMSKARTLNSFPWAVVLNRCSEIASEKTKQSNARVTDRVRLTLRIW